MENLKADEDPTLLRIIYVALFYFVFALSEFLVIFIAIFQSLYVLIAGEPQQDVRRFGGTLGRYVDSIISYISWNSNEKPFPFSDWPHESIDAQE